MKQLSATPNAAIFGDAQSAAPTFGDAISPTWALPQNRGKEYTRQGSNL
jgi:hypothetical protein